MIGLCVCVYYDPPLLVTVTPQWYAKSLRLSMDCLTKRHNAESCDNCSLYVCYMYSNEYLFNFEMLLFITIVM